MLMPNEVLIGGHNWQRHAAHTPPGQGKGYVRRDWGRFPRGYYPNVQAVDFPTFPQSEWPARLKDQAARNALLSNVCLNAGVPVLDQNGKGYCWAHSTTGAVQAARAVMNEPTVGLSAYSVACIVKSYRDQGGWGAESADFIAQNGVADEQHWPQRSMSRSNDNPTTRENMKRYRLSVQLADMNSGEYDRNLTWAQYATCWLLNVPTVNDYNWWSHSVHGADLVEGASTWGLCRDEDSGKLMTLEQFDLCWEMNSGDVSAGWGCRIRNSWGGSYGQNGYGVLAASKAVPDGGVGVLVVTPSA